MTDRNSNVEAFTFTHNEENINAFIVSGVWATLDAHSNVVTIERD